MQRGPRFGRLGSPFSETSLIYGPELTALVLAIAGHRIHLNNSCITMYVDNNCALSALLKASCFRAVISVLTRLLWAICAARGITPRLGRVGSDVNISDIPTMGADLPSEEDQVSDLPTEEQLSVLAKGGVKAQTGGYFDPELLIGGLYSNVYARTGEGRP